MRIANPIPIASLFAVLLCGVACAGVHHVEQNGTGDFTIIQHAVEAAADGDTILIGPGHYQDTHEYVPDVDLAVFNVRGQLIKRLVSETKDKGEHAVVWDGRDNGGAQMASGVYFARFVSGQVTMTRRLVLVQ